MFEYFNLYYIQQIKGIFWIIGDAAFILLANLLFFRFSPKGKKWRFYLIRLICSYIGLLMAESLYYIIFEDDKYLLTVVYLIVISGLAISAREWRKVSRLVMGSVYYVVYLYSLGISQGLDFLRLSEEIYPTVTTALRLLFVLLAVVFMRIFSIEEVADISWHTLLLIEIACLMTFLISSYYTAIRIPGHSETDNLMMLVYVAFFVIILVVYYMFRGIARSIEENAGLRGQNLLIELEAGRVEIAESAMEEMRKTRHDMKNHLYYIKTLLEQKQYENAEHYLEELTDSMEQAIAYIDCGNQNLNAILNFEKGRAEKAGIILRTDVLVPETLPFLETDMCSLLCNLLENAIEACESNHLAGVAVDIKIHIRGDYMLIRVVNPLPERHKNQEVLNLETTKANKQNHGYGIRIIRNIAGKYNGDAKFKVEDRLFVADVMLDMKGAL